jgi:hypothetical protein
VSRFSRKNGDLGVAFGLFEIGYKRVSDFGVAFQQGIIIFGVAFQQESSFQFGL